MLKPAVPMNSNPTLLEPSFVDAMIAIGKADDLSDQHRRHWSCSLKQIGKWLDRPLSLISGPLDLGADARGAIAPCPGRRHGQDNGQSQVKRPGCASLVQQRARRAAPWRTAIAEVADFARQHQGRRTTGPALRLDALLPGRGIEPLAVNDSILDCYLVYPPRPRHWPRTTWRGAPLRGPGTPA